MRSCLPNVHSASFLGFFQLATSQAAAPILTINTSKDVVSHKDVPFGGPEKKLQFDPIFAKKPKLLADFRKNKISAQNGL